MKKIFSNIFGIILTGSFIGIVVILLQFYGNPANMGICMACFERDIVGAIGMHRALQVQYIRPEIVGIILGSLISSIMAKEFIPKGGSSATIRFFLGFFAMIGALVFLGCPWRAILRIGGGDLNGITGIAGFGTGIFIGTLFLKKGFSLGKSSIIPHKAAGLVMPAFLSGLLFLLIINFPKLLLSAKGPGSMRAPLILSLSGGLIIGILAQKSRFCTMGAIRDIFIIKNFLRFFGILSFLVTVIIGNIITGKLNFGFTGQPAAHTMHLWNFLGMVLCGLAFLLSGGCPGRHLILAGEGNSDSSVFVLGMFFGAACAHNLGSASNGKGTGPYGEIAVILGILFCLSIGFFMVDKRK